MRAEEPSDVLSGVLAEARILREEVFGPVAPITAFTDEREAVRQANDTEFGLVAGGVKASGFGREGGSEGIAEYLDTKYMALAVG